MKYNRLNRDKYGWTLRESGFKLMAGLLSRWGTPFTGMVRIRKKLSLAPAYGIGV